MAWSRKIVLTFESREKRDQFRKLAAELGYEEHALANRMLNNLVGYLEELKQQSRKKEVPA
jgi:hypothetical protein